MRNLAFCQKFALNRGRLSLLLRCIAENKATSNDAIADYMGVNKPVAEGFRGWLHKTSLGNSANKSYQLTPLGELVHTHDPQLHDIGTAWLLHYALVSEYQERAEVWYRCFNEFLQPSIRFKTADLARYIDRHLDDTPANISAVSKDAAMLVNCYTEAANLGNLGLLTRNTKDEIAVGSITPPDALLIGFILLDSWQRRLGTVDSVRLSALVNEPESIGRVFVADLPQVRGCIAHIERLNLVTFADTQFEPVTRRYFDDPLTLVQRYYEQR